MVTVLGGAGFIAWRFLREAPSVLDKLKPGALKQEEPGASGGPGPAALQAGGSASPGSAASSGSADPGSASSGISGAGASSANGKAAATKAELYERAKQLGIEGRSKMSKRDLERAIRDAG
jgi:hypothetical protein